MPDTEHTYGDSEVERLAELHWIGYTMTARITAPTPMWDDLDSRQRTSLVTAMELMLELGHLSVPNDEREASR